MDGFGFFAILPGLPGENRPVGNKITACDSFGNDRQGLRAEFTDDLTVDDGKYYDNDAAGIQIERGCKDVVIKNVEVYGNNRYQITVCGESGIWIAASDNVLVENCDVHNNANGIRVSGPNGDDSNDVILRYNRVYDNKPPVPADRCGSEFGIDVYDSNRVALYHNTIWNHGDAFSDAGFSGVTPSNASTSTDIFFKNNIVGGSNGDLQIKIGSGSQYEDFENNVYYDPPATNSYSVDGTAYKFYGNTSYKDEMDSYQFEYVSVESSSNPLDSSLKPVSGGDAHDEAIALTHAPGVFSNFVELDDNSYFRVGDTIRFSGTASGTAKITGYSGIYTQLDSAITGTGGTGALVWHDRPYNTEPDIGAIER